MMTRSAALRVVTTANRVPGRAPSVLKDRQRLPPHRAHRRRLPPSGFAQRSLTAALMAALPYRPRKQENKHAATST
jgi:hypothetical protein